MNSEDILDQPDLDCVYIPSQTIDPEEISKLLGFVFYEERPLLCSLLRLRSYPTSRLVFVTSVKIQPAVLSYYLQLATDSTVSEASIRDRLLLLDVNDASPYPLTQKILDKPEMIKTIKDWIRPEKSFMRCIISTKLEELLASNFGIPLRANPSHLASWGTKHGSRTIFKQAKIPLPDGIEQVFTVKELIEGILKLWERNPTHVKYVAKLNDGVSGDGNAVFYLLRDNINLSYEEKLKYIEETLRCNMEFGSNNENWNLFEKKLKKRGAIVELWIEGTGATSPSAQGFITDDTVIVLSTHEQILKKSLYVGCHFPAAETYRKQLCANVLKIGEALQSQGARERFGVDFIVIPPSISCDSQQPSIYAIEINLRSGGTTHPCETARLICKGKYCPNTGLLIACDNIPKYYQASDNLVNTLFKNLTFEQIGTIIQQSESRWNKESMVGCVFYFLGALKTCGKVGMLAVGNSTAQAKCFFEEASKALHDFASTLV